MGSGHEIRSYDYVNHPYERVRDALTADPTSVFAAATRAAAKRAHSVAAELRVKLAGFEVATEIALEIGPIAEGKSEGGGGPVTRIPVDWEAADRPRLFPLMRAVLAIYPLTSTETQLDFLGHYDPPMGLLGDALNAVAGHRLAEASVHRFVGDVAGHLRQALTAT